MGYLIQTFDLPPFIITLAGLYLARGLCYVVSIDTIAITNAFFQAAAHAQVKIFGGASSPPGAVIAHRRGAGRLPSSRATRSSVGRSTPSAATSSPPC